MTDMMQTDEVVLKTDKLGRVKTPVSRREELLDEFERSGVSGVKFAELTGVKYQTLATWLKKRRQQRGMMPAKVPVKSSESMRWLEAVVEGARPGGAKNVVAMVLELPGGAKVEIGNAQQAVLAAELIRALGRPC